MSAPRNPVVVIPSRLASKRLPDKPLADINGKPMIVHVWLGAVAADVGPVVVACGDAAIAAAVEAAGGRAVMTRPDHPSGSDRVFEALTIVDPAGAHDAVVNLQGDMVDVDNDFPDILAAVIAPLADGDVDIATVAAPFADDEERENPNAVKAIVATGEGSRPRRALAFSRTAASIGDGVGEGMGDGALYHHIGIYAYRPQALARFVALPEGVAERKEKLEQLRAMEAGMRIDVGLVDRVPLEINTPADLERARALLVPGTPG
jgi:3-deoxy-manno-octulosonate cytidylyltransferase (CMP-KDO synthetase)